MSIWLKGLGLWLRVRVRVRSFAFVVQFLLKYLWLHWHL